MLTRLSLQDNLSHVPASSWELDELRFLRVTAMAADPKDILLVGLGAVGAIYAFILQSKGLARVTVVARSNYEAVKENGMHIKSLKYGDHEGWRPYRIFGSVEDAADRAYSHVVLLTKVIPELQTNTELLRALLSAPYTDRFPQPVYVLMQNGMYIESDLWDSVKALNQGPPKIIGTSVYIGTKLLDRNVVEHSDFDRVSMGIHREELNVTTNTPEESAILSEFGDILATGGTQVTVVPEIQRIKFHKNAWNCTLGPICALSRHSLQALFRKPLDAPSEDENGEPVVSRSSDLTPAQRAVAGLPTSFPMVAEYTIPWLYESLEEVQSLGQKLFPDAEAPGVNPNLPMSVMTGTARIVTKPTSNERPSMLVDVELGRPMEVEVIVGSVIRAAKRHGVSMPRIETLYALLLLIQENALYEFRKKKNA
ncbi:hypothetical protein EIP91_003699 [Steccherinum ochraceum]|uniref:Ketopantoate reductase C-terminal domain-containing protein n=1 Tax=Steccherinum ochraceum TaxID=92696 RepID=A0A4V2MXI7_9APHY|nr:hypothetical protein EIP91_003699 [Steccherinum ochraceum]